MNHKASRCDLLAFMWTHSENRVCAMTANEIGIGLNRKPKAIQNAIWYLRDEGVISADHYKGAHKMRWRVNVKPEDYYIAPPERAPVFQVRYDWTSERLNALPALWEAGHPVSVICQKLGFPSEAKNAVIGRAHRMRLSRRLSPIIRVTEPSTRPSHARRPEMPKPMLPKLVSEGGTPLFDYTVLLKPVMPVPLAKTAYPVKVKQPKAPRPVVERSKLIDFRSSQPARVPKPKFHSDDGVSPMGPSPKPCQWVVVDGSVTTPWVHCGVDRVSWPYCAGHRKLAYFRPNAAEAA